MPQFILLRRTDPEVGYMAVLNQHSEVASTPLQLDDNEVAYHVIENQYDPATDVAVTGVEACGGNALQANYGNGAGTAQGLKEYYMGIVGPNNGPGIPASSWGLVQVWGYRADADLTGGEAAGENAHVAADSAVTITGYVPGVYVEAESQNGNQVGIFLTTTAVFIKSMGQ